MDFLHGFVGKDGLIHLKLAAVFRCFQKQILLASNVCKDRRHQLFTDRVKRRIRHLGKKLLEIVVEQLRFFRQHRQRRIHPHCGGRLHPLGGHRAD